jgi:hypothetical protein
MIACDALMRYLDIMRTTITLPDHLLVQAKQLAAERRTSFTAIVEESLRAYLSRARADEAARTSEVALPLMDGGAPRDGVDLDDTSALWEL